MTGPLYVIVLTPRRLLGGLAGVVGGVRAKEEGIRDAKHAVWRLAVADIAVYNGVAA